MQIAATGGNKRGGVEYYNTPTASNTNRARRMKSLLASKTVV